MLVRDQPLSVNEIAAQFHISQQAVSQHLHVLKDAGLVVVHPDGPRRLYTIRPEGLTSIEQFLSEFWPERLGRLKSTIESKARHQPLRLKFTSSVVVDSEPADVYEYFTKPEAMVHWMGQVSSLNPVPGGEFAVDVNGSSAIRGRLVELDPPHRLVFTWGFIGSEDLPPGTSTVEVLFIPEDGRTRIDIVHRDLPETEASKHAPGWRHFLDQLAEAVVQDFLDPRAEGR